MKTSTCHGLEIDKNNTSFAGVTTVHCNFHSCKVHDETWPRQNNSQIPH